MANLQSAGLCPRKKEKCQVEVLGGEDCQKTLPRASGNDQKRKEVFGGEDGQKTLPRASGNDQKRKEWPPPSLVPLGPVGDAQRPTYVAQTDPRSVILSKGVEQDSDEMCSFLLDRWSPVWSDVISSWRMSKTMRGSGDVKDPYFYPPGVPYSRRIRSKRRLRWVLEHMIQTGLRDYNAALEALEIEAARRPIGPIAEYLPRDEQPCPKRRRIV